VLILQSAVLLCKEMSGGRSACFTSNCAALTRDDGRQECIPASLGCIPDSLRCIPASLGCIPDSLGCIPASLGCKTNRVVGDGSPDEGLDKGDRQAHDGGGDHKGPAGEEQIISLLEEDFHAVNLQVSAIVMLYGGIQHHSLCMWCRFCEYSGKLTMLAMPKTQDVRCQTTSNSTGCTASTVRLVCSRHICCAMRTCTPTHASQQR